MVKIYAPLVMVVATVICWPTRSSALPVPNRGTQLFALFEGRGGYGTLVAMTPPHRPVIQTWHPRKGTYDFILAVVRRTRAGCKVAFTRYVMKEDYIPRTEHLELTFPYNQQPCYAFFDYGVVTGFYRNSVHDIDPHEFLPRKTSNQTMQPTQHFVVSSRSMRTLMFKVLGGLSLSRSEAEATRGFFVHLN